MSAVIQTSTFQTPLSHIVPCKCNETVVVTDSVSCDGRFVLYTYAASILDTTVYKSSSVTVATTTSRVDISSESNTTKNSRVLWISCTPTTDEAIQNALKKIGCDKLVVSSAGRMVQQRSEVADPKVQFDGNERLSILSILNLLESNMIVTNGFDEVNFVKILYGRIKDFVSIQVGCTSTIPTAVIIDDISALSALIGERLAYATIHSLQSLKQSNEMITFGLVVRCSNEHDIEATGLSTTGTVSGVAESDLIATTDIPWERALVELADTLIDVSHLSSGYSREVHGRLTITTRLPDVTSSSIYNFCVSDNQVLVMRLATG